MSEALPISVEVTQPIHHEGMQTQLEVSRPILRPVVGDKYRLPVEVPVFPSDDHSVIFTHFVNFHYDIESKTGQRAVTYSVPGVDMGHFRVINHEDLHALASAMANDDFGRLKRNLRLFYSTSQFYQDNLEKHLVNLEDN